MADITRLSRLVNGIQRQVDLSSNTLVLDANHATFSGTLTAARTISMPDANVNLGAIATNSTHVAGDGTDHSAVSGHLNGGSNKHDASEIDVEAADGNYYSAGDLETVIGALDDQIKSNADNITAGSDDQTAAEVTYTQGTTSDWTVADGSSVKATLDEVGGRLTTNESAISSNASGISGNDTDISNLQGALGSSTEAAIDYSSNNYVTDGEDVVTAIGDLDTQVKTNADAISSLSSATYFKGSATSFADLNPASVGDYFVVTSAFSTVNVGDHLIAKVEISSDPTDLSDFAIVDNTEASDIVRTSDTGTVTNTMLAGSIADGKLASDYVQTSEVDDSSIEWSGTALQVKASGITNDMLAGSIADGKLASDYVQTSEVDDSSIEWSGSALQVKASGITNDMLAGSIATSKMVDATELAEAVTFFGSTDLSAAEAETLSDGSNADSLHKHGVMVKTMVAGEAFSGTATPTVYAIRMAINGETDTRVYKADDDASSSDKFHVIGLAYVSADIAAGENIDVIMLGEVTSSVAFTASQDEGKAVYLGSTGAVTLSPSTSADDAVVKIGMVSKVGAAGTAKIMVSGIQIMGVN